jgi:hypothetical protein
VYGDILRVPRSLYFPLKTNSKNRQATRPCCYSSLIESTTW